jgi:hypothetical protein
MKSLKEMQQMKQPSNKILEHLSAKDLKWMVEDNLLIDMHKTKLGKDKDYVVLSMAVKDKVPAIDLAKFIENSVYKYEDVEVSGATDTQGRYLVYVELKRDPELFEKIQGILSDAGHLTGIETWNFKTMGLSDYIPFDGDAFAQHVISDSSLYEQRHPSQDEEQAVESVQESIKSRLKFLLRY